MNSGVPPKFEDALNIRLLQPGAEDAPRKYPPFEQPDGTVRLSTEVDPEEMRAWGRRMARAGALGALNLVRAFDFLRDGNRMKNAMPQAERWCLAIKQFQMAVQAARQSRAEEWIELTTSAMKAFEPQYPDLVLQALEVFHDAQTTKLKASKSGPRQLAIAKKTRKELERLNAYELPENVALRYAAIVQYWNDQYLVSERHSVA